jgi:hypothetical protein
MENIQTLETMPLQTIDFSQFAPLVTEFQKGEIEKLKIHNEAQVAVAQMNNERQMQVDRNTAARDIRHDRYDGATTWLLFIVCAGMMVFGMWSHDNGFITAGVTSFASFLAGKHSSGAKPRI